MSNPLELVHSDLCCIDNSSLSSSRYVLSFVDDISHYTWVNFMENKIRVLEGFKELTTLDAKQCGRMVKCLRSNNGGVYVSQ